MHWHVVFFAIRIWYIGFPSEVRFHEGLTQHSLKLQPVLLCTGGSFTLFSHHSFCKLHYDDSFQCTLEPPLHICSRLQTFSWSLRSVVPYLQTRYLTWAASWTLTVKMPWPIVTVRRDSVAAIPGTIRLWTGPFASNVSALHHTLVLLKFILQSKHPEVNLSEVISCSWEIFISAYLTYPHSKGMLIFLIITHVTIVLYIESDVCGNIFYDNLGTLGLGQLADYRISMNH